MDCKNCDNRPAAVPYLVYEGEMARGERNLKRLWITVILLICLLVGSNVGWLIYESQFMTEEYTVESNTDGGNIGGGYSGYYPRYAYARNQRRSANGRYSRDDGRDAMIEKLEDMMEDAPDEKTRSAIQKCISMMERD